MSNRAKGVLDGWSLTPEFYALPIHGINPCDADHATFALSSMPEDVKHNQLLFVVLSGTHLFFFSKAQTINIVRS